MYVRFLSNGIVISTAVIASLFASDTSICTSSLYFPSAEVSDIVFVACMAIVMITIHTIVNIFFIGYTQFYLFASICHRHTTTRNIRLGACLELGSMCMNMNRNCLLQCMYQLCDLLRQ